MNSNDLDNFYKSIDPMVKQSTVNWRVYNLVQEGILTRVGRGKFILGAGRSFIPKIDSRAKALYNRLTKQFPYLQVCIWHTSIFNELMLHQQGRFYTLVEVEKEATESVFYFLREVHLNVFLDPGLDILNRYAQGGKDIIIIKPLVSEAPMQKVDGVNTVSIEKLMVDIFCDDLIFAAQQGAEMEFIFTEAYSRYTVNESRMLRYADRRRKKTAFDSYLKRIPKYRQQIK